MNVHVTAAVVPWNELADPGAIRTSKQYPISAPAAPTGLATGTTGTTDVTARYEPDAPAMNTGVPVVNAAALHVDPGFAVAMRIARYWSAGASAPVLEMPVSATVPATFVVGVVRTLSHAKWETFGDIAVAANDSIAPGAAV